MGSCFKKQKAGLFEKNEEQPYVHSFRSDACDRIHMQDTTQLAPPRLHGAHLMAHQKQLQLQQERQQQLLQEQEQANSSAIVFGAKAAPRRGKGGAMLLSSPMAVASAVVPSPLSKPPRFSSTLVPDNKDVSYSYL